MGRGNDGKIFVVVNTFRVVLAPGLTGLGGISVYLAFIAALSSGWNCGWGDTGTDQIDHLFTGTDPGRP